MAELICGKHQYNGIHVRTPCPICTIQEDTGTTAEDIFKELEPRIEAIEDHVAQHKPFLSAALAYCESKIEYLDLRRKITELAKRCDLLDFNAEYGAFVGYTCFQMRVQTGPDDDESLPQEQWCEQCQEAIPLVERRRELGRRMSSLAIKMYGQYRKLKKEGEAG